MNFKMMGRFLALIVALEAAFMVPALILSLCFAEQMASKAFVLTIGIMAVAAGLMWLICRKAPKRFGARDGMVCVSIGWVLLSVFGCLPFLFSGEIPRFVDALFEIVSGFTTTGASVLSDVESVAKSILYWRSFSHWLGGMGVLVFLLAVAPGDSQGKGFTMHLLRAESPGPDVGKLVPKMKQTAMILYLIYVVMTVINILFLLAGRMDPLEAVCTAFGTAGTGGFGVKNDSLASYSPYIQNVTTVFMILFGVNFSCYYLILMRNILGVLKDEELRLYIGLILGSIVLITLNIYGRYETLGETLRHAAFQVGSIITTTGYATADFDQWPTFSKSILMLLMITGACAGSTGGGLKCARVLLLFKNLRRNIRKLMNPRKVLVVRTAGRPVSETVVDNTHAYLAAYVTIIILGILLISLDGFDTETNLTAVLSCFNNIGPGLGAVGPTCNFSIFSDFSTVVLTLVMLLGRLEIFPLLVLLSRSTWKGR